MTLPDLSSLGWSTLRPHQAAGLAAPVSPSLGRIENLTAVVSGKGGVGKTNLVANLAVACAGQGARVLVIDGDAGLANLDVLMGVVPRHSVIDVMRGRCVFDDALVRGPKGIFLLPAGSGRRDLAAFENGGAERLLEDLRHHAKEFDRVLLDAGSGIGEVVVDLASIASRIWLVATPEPTSFADAYATYKTLLSRDADVFVELVVNCARDERQGRDVHRHLERMCDRFLASELPLRAVLLRDPKLVDAVSRQQLLIEAFPTAPLAKRMTKLAHEWMRE